MKKNFFKKLSFVMAAAMVLTSLAPAASASAATTPSVSESSKTLLLGVDGRSSYDFNVNNKVKGSTYAWSSSNKAAATVAKNGVVTGKAIGATTVTVKVTLPTGKVVKDSIKVVVKDNIKELTITNTPADNKLAAGVENNFNRSYVTDSGSKTATTSITRWEVTSDNAKTATIDNSGIFKATATGKYTVTARAFQSAAKYTAWLADKTLDYVLDDATYTFDVVNKIDSFTAVKSDTARVTFAAAVDSVKTTDFVVTDVKTSVKQYVKSATLSTDKKSVDLVFYNALTNGNTYSLVATVGTEMKAELTFTKGAVAKIEASSQVIPADGQAHAIVYKVFDVNGLDITADTTVYFESTIPTAGTLNLADKTMAYVTVVYTDVTNGQQVKSVQFTVTGSLSAASAIGGYTLADTSNEANFTTPVTSVALGDTAKEVYVQATNQYGTTITAANGTDVTFVSLDPSVVVVDELTGAVTPISAGTGYVKIVAGTLTKIVPITVKAAAVATSLQLSAVTAGSLTGTDRLNDPSVTVSVLDQYGNKLTTAQNVTFTLLSGTGVVNGLVNGAYTESIIGSAVVDFDAAVVGTAYFKVTCGNLPAQYVALSVGTENNVQTGYTLSGVIDLNVDEYYNPTVATGYDSTAVSVYSINSSNQKINVVTGADISIIVTKPDGTSAAAVTGGAINLAVNAAPISNTKGSYVVTAYKNGVAIASKTFVVSDTATAPTVTLSVNTIAGADATLNKLATLFSVPTGYTITNISYVSSNKANISDKAFDSVNPDVLGTATLYNIKVEVTRTAGAVQRPFVVSIPGSITVTQ